MAIPKIEPTVDFDQLETDLRDLSKTDPEKAKRLRRGYFVDTLAPVGNKRAYQLFEKRHRDHGVHVHVDLNDLHSLNKIHGDEAGDYAISTFGHIASKVGRRLGGKSFRFGGDEFKHHFANESEARQFVQDLHKEVTKTNLGLPKFKLSFSAGVGQGRDQAESALIQAKQTKKALNKEPGTNDNHIAFHASLGQADPLGKSEKDNHETAAAWHLAAADSHDKLGDIEDLNRHGAAREKHLKFAYDHLAAAGHPEGTIPDNVRSAKVDYTPAPEFEHHASDKMLKSEGLIKEMWGSSPERQQKMLGFHGWIAPDGEFHEMDPEQNHTSFIMEHLGMDDDNIDEFENRTSSDIARSNGWISVGHAGDPNAMGHRKYLDDPNHPATRTLARMVANLHPDLKKERFTVETDADKPYEIPHGLASKGHFKKPSTTQMFRSEDLGKEMWDGSEDMKQFHGMISPDGAFHRMGPSQQHTQVALNHVTKKHPEMQLGSRHEALPILYGEGWISTGHAGNNEVRGASATLNDINHPATRKLMELVRGLPERHQNLTVRHLGPDDPSNPSMRGHDVPRAMAEKGNFKKPSTTQMFRSEDLAKTGRDWHPSFHGFISPLGNYHHLGPSELHDSKFESIGGESSFEDRHLHQGWIGLGHLRENWVSMAPTTHDNPDHPATKVLAEKVRQHPSAKDITVISATGDQWDVPRNLAEKGIFKQPSLMRQFKGPRKINLHTDDSIHTLDGQGNIVGTQYTQKSEEDLQKSAESDLLQMYKPDTRESAKPFVQWARKTLPNKDWQMWAVRHHRNDPGSITNDVKGHLEHYSSLQHVPAIANLRLGQTPVKTAIDMFKNVEQTYNQKKIQDLNLVPKPKGATKIVDAGTRRPRQQDGLVESECQ